MWRRKSELDKVELQIPFWNFFFGILNLLAITISIFSTWVHIDFVHYKNIVLQLPGIPIRISKNEHVYPLTLFNILSDLKFINDSGSGYLPSIKAVLYFMFFAWFCAFVSLVLQFKVNEKYQKARTVFYVFQMMFLLIALSVFGGKTMDIMNKETTTMGTPGLVLAILDLIIMFLFIVLIPGVKYLKKRFAPVRSMGSFGTGDA